MNVNFTHRDVDFQLALHPRLITEKDKNLKAYRKWGLGSPIDAVSARIYARNTFYALPDLEESLKYIPSGSTIVDCGAFIGNHTVFWNKLNSNKVIAFEPFPESFKLLEKNVQLNNCTDCSLRQCLIGNSEGKFSCKSSDRRYAANHFESDPNGKYSSVTLDSSVGSDVDISFIKIDVEGDEFSVLQGANGLLKRCHPFLQVEIHEGVKIKSIMQYLSEFDYKIGEDVLFLGKHAKKQL